MSLSLNPNSCFVENNIVHQMDESETTSFVEKNANKYSKSHRNEILNVLAKVNEKIRVVSFNVLFSKGDHFLKPQNRWENRKISVIEAIKQMDPDVLGIQEPLDPQIEYIQENLDAYSYFGSKDNSGMNVGLFFKKERFDLVDQNSFHLESPDQTFEQVTNNSAWKAKRKELIHLKLMDKKTAKILHVFNAHLSFFQADWREMDAAVTFQRAKDVLEKEGDQSQVVIMGDWNTFPAQLDSSSMPFWDGSRIQKIIKGDLFLDADQEALMGHMGPISTFTNDPKEEKITPFKGQGTPGVVLDHIFISKKMTPLVYAVNPILIDGEFPSDHMPVVTDLILDDPKTFSQTG